MSPRRRMTAEELERLVAELGERAAASRDALEHSLPGAGALLDALSAERNRHGFESPLPMMHVVDGHPTVIGYRGRCSCGWQQTRTAGTRAVANRAAGMHRSRADKRAEKTYDAAIAALTEKGRNR